MPLFISINNINVSNSSQVVKVLILYKTDNRFKDIIKHAMAALTEPSDSAPKE